MAVIHQELKRDILELNADAARVEQWDSTAVYLKAVRYLATLQGTGADDGLILRQFYTHYAENAGYQGYTDGERTAVRNLMRLTEAAGARIGVKATVAPLKPRTAIQKLQDQITDAECELELWVNGTAGAEGFEHSKSLREALERVQALQILLNSTLRRRSDGWG